ncbi:hypothetical protein J4217_01100 [Candidatus Pacearchaeota archaeon]|nr:hypothetical protein [Candidatus Pacearchaeota archaeon]
MPIALAEYTDEELIKLGIDPALRKNTISVPKWDEIRLTQREQYLLGRLFDPLFTDPRYFPLMTG